MTLALRYAAPAAVTVPAFAALPLTLASSFVETVDDWLAQVEERLTQLLLLPKGWDGYQSQRVTPQTARFVTNVLNSVMAGHTPAPSIVPVSGGGLQVEWHRNGLDIELYVAKPMQAELYVSFGDDRPDLERELTSDFGVLSTVLAELA